MIPQEAKYFGRQQVWWGAGFEYLADKTLTADTTLTDNDPRLCLLDASGGIFTAFLPASPYRGQTRGFSENVGDATAVTIDGNGKNIDGNPTYTMNVAYRTRWFRYNGTQWISIGGAN